MRLWFLGWLKIPHDVELGLILRRLSIVYVLLDELLGVQMAVWEIPMRGGGVLCYGVWLHHLGYAAQVLGSVILEIFNLLLLGPFLLVLLSYFQRLLPFLLLLILLLQRSLILRIDLPPKLFFLLINTKTLTLLATLHFTISFVLHFVDFLVEPIFQRYLRLHIDHLDVLFMQNRGRVNILLYVVSTQFI